MGYKKGDKALFIQAIDVHEKTSNPASNRKAMIQPAHFGSPNRSLKTNVQTNASPSAFFKGSPGHTAADTEHYI